MDRHANVIHAYDAGDLGTELWNSGQHAGGTDALGAVVKFAVPTVANGEVFVGTADSLVVYGLLAQPTLVQQVSTSNTRDPSTALTQFDFYLPNPTLANNCIIVGIQYNSAQSITSVTDDQNNTYTAGPAASGTATNGNGATAIYYSLGSTAGARHITVTFSGSTSYVSVTAAEFYNVATTAAVDGSSGNASDSSTSWSAGSFTTTTGGDLIYNFAAEHDRSGGVPWLGNSITAGSGFNLLSADLMDGSAAQYQVQSTSGSINPTMTASPDAPYSSVAIALKAARAGTAPAAGIRIVGAQHNSVPGTISTVNLQFPSTGNLIAAMWIGFGDPNCHIDSITDSNGNTYTTPGASVDNSFAGDGQVFYAAKATTGASLTLTVPLNRQGNGSTLVLYDITGAADSPYDTWATGTGYQSDAGDLTTVTLTPSTAKGLVLDEVGINNGTVGNTVGSSYLFDAATYPTEHGGQNPLDQDNGWGHFYNPDTSPVTFTWTLLHQAPATDWVGVAAAFKPLGG
jgi:hypothetical protein